MVKAGRSGEKPVKCVTESDKHAVYKKFLHIDMPYQLKKCAVFVRTILRKKRDDTFGSDLGTFVDSKNSRADKAKR